jgi:AmiR/NasT family two-component response regulator
MTGYSTRSDEESAAEAGVKAFVRKPLELHSLLHIIGRLFKEKKGRG